MAETRCRHFNGYKPCGLSDNCDRSCAHFDEVMHHVVVVHLGALGAVLRSTALLPAIHRAFPKAKLTWVTQSPAEQLLLHNPAIDRVLTLRPEDQYQLAALKADAVFCIDKSLTAAGIAANIRTSQVRGFKADPITGAILPATGAAHELWSLGLSNEKKFFQNQKTENQLIHEALDLGAYHRDEYNYVFTPLEADVARNRRDLWAPKREVLIGLNTGCSGMIPYKKLSVAFQRRLIVRLLSTYGSRVKVVLLGGKEDERRNRDIAEGLAITSSPVDRGLRDGMMSVAACDIVISGDSLGLHMAIAQKKWSVAWFGPTCAHEIELYNRGFKVLTKAPCSPCWKRVCDRQPMCYDLVEIDEIMGGVAKGMEWVNRETNSLSKPHSPATYSSASRF